MLAQAQAAGAAAALAHFGLKTAGWRDWGRGLVSNMIGTPGKLFVEGPRALGRGGSMSPKNVFWPDVKGPGGSRWNWLQRANTLMAPLAIHGAMKDPPRDPDDPTPPPAKLPRLMGAVGGVIGSAYGQHGLGMLGAPLVGSAGARLGQGLGNLIS